MRNVACPKTVDPWYLAEVEAVLTATAQLTCMPRLKVSLAEPAGTAHFVLRFKKESGFALIHGAIETSLPLICQRCMQAMVQDIDTHFSLRPVHTNAEALRLPKHCEPLVTHGRAVNIVNDIIEEELLLCLPLVPLHPPVQCRL